MAERRMISKSVVNTDQFKELPIHVQYLYMTMILNADDDGFIANAKELGHGVRTKAKALQMLCDRGYVLYFERRSVALIVHWELHNKISPSRKTKTVFQEEYNMVEICDNIYRLREGGNEEIVKKNVFIGEGRIGEDRVGLSPSSRGERAPLPSPAPTAAASAPTREEVADYAEEHGLTAVDVDAFCRYYGERGWVTRTGNAIRWQLKLADWDAKDKAAGSGPGSGSGRTRDRPTAGGSFDTDDFFDAACRRGFDDL